MGAMSGCRIGLVRRRALRANADFGSKVRGCVIAGAVSGAFRDKTLVSAGRRMLYSAAIRFYACEAPEDALFESVP